MKKKRFYGILPVGVYLFFMSVGCLPAMAQNPFCFPDSLMQKYNVQTATLTTYLLANNQLQGKGKVQTSYVFSRRGKVIKESNHLDGSYIKYTYNSLGQLKKKIYYSAQNKVEIVEEHLRTYEGRLTAIHTPENKKTYTYNAQDQLMKVQEFYPDPVTKQFVPSSQATFYAYNPEGFKEQIVFQKTDSSQVISTTIYEYYADNTLVKTYEQFLQEAPVENIYRYNPAGQLVEHQHERGLTRYIYTPEYLLTKILKAPSAKAAPTELTQATYKEYKKDVTLNPKKETDK